MIYIQNTTDFYSAMRLCESAPANQPLSAVTLGKFDGLHRGHQKLLNRILQLQSDGYYGIVFSIAPEDRTALFTPEEKRHFLESYGVDCMIRCPFVPDILGMEPEAFIAEVLCRQLRAKYIVVGTDFRFGFQRKGDAAFLKKMQKKYNFTLIVEEKECYEGREISSTYIREALASADMELVRTLMGHWFPVEGTVLHGHQLGRKIGMPTINIRPDGYKLLPPPGVYYSDVILKRDETSRITNDIKNTANSDAINVFDERDTLSDLPDKKIDGCDRVISTDLQRTSDIYSSGAGISTCHGITNIGYKPTVDGTFLGVETYLYGIHETLYGADVTVLLRHFRRPEQKFVSVEDLKAQMTQDIRSGEEYFGGK
ncbi:MAG: bifunctional riboflavin kinase/FMN adenylyltransferase [Lachnospiraceae bacterium]|nr:bifunctional riboflavin kinase/FMN adenylyltransferase [Lachnospiraceae bacterium]